MPLVRLQKVIAASGFASRRVAESLIVSGRVSVNGEIVTELGTKVDPDIDSIDIDGKKISAQIKKYILLNKPGGYLTTLRDERGRRTVLDLLKEVDVLVKPVGRLDLDTEGLLILTNDGELAFRLSHPGYGVTKKYLARVKGAVTAIESRKLAKGVSLEEGITAPAKVKVLESGRTSVAEITVHEGKKRQIKRMFRTVGHEVIKLKRVGYAGLEISDLEPGQYRELTAKEVRYLKSLVGLPPTDQSKL